MILEILGSGGAYATPMPGTTHPVDIDAVDRVSGGDAAHPVLQTEATFEETVSIARRLNAKPFVSGHIKAPDDLSHAELEGFATDLRATGLRVTVAYDGLRLPLDAAHP